jgi:hypothetical protein
MSELFPVEPSIATTGADPGRRKAAAHEAHGAQTFAVTSAPAATPIADMIETMLSAGAAAAGAQTVNQNSTLVDHYSEPNPSQKSESARSAFGHRNQGEDGTMLFSCPPRPAKVANCTLPLRRSRAWEFAPKNPKKTARIPCNSRRNIYRGANLLC